MWPLYSTLMLPNSIHSLLYYKKNNSNSVAVDISIKDNGKFFPVQVLEVLFFRRKVVPCFDGSYFLPTRHLFDTRRTLGILIVVGRQGGLVDDVSTSLEIGALHQFGSRLQAVVPFCSLRKTVMQACFLYVVEPDGCLRAFSDGTHGIEPGRVVVLDGFFALNSGDELLGLVPAMLVGKALDGPDAQAELFGDSHVVIVRIEGCHLPEFVRGDVLSSWFH